MILVYFSWLISPSSPFCLVKLTPALHPGWTTGGPAQPGRLQAATLQAGLASEGPTRDGMLQLEEAVRPAMPLMNGKFVGSLQTHTHTYIYIIHINYIYIDVVI